MLRRVMLRGVLLATGGIGLALLAGERQQASANGNTESVCHVDGQGRSHLLHLNATAAAAHRNHGDFDAATWYLDQDGDGYGTGAGVVACDAPAGHVLTDGDCNDSDSAVNPAAFDTCEDRVDNNCDGDVDEEPFARVLLHCDAGSEQILSLCGPGPHDITGNTFVNGNISYLDFGINTTGGTLTKCRRGGGSPDSVTVIGDTNLCELSGGCCDDPTRYNDNVCVIELF